MVFKDFKPLVNRWNVVNERPFSQKCIDMVSEATVVNSDYGQSVCFLMVSGDKKYIPMVDHNYPVGMKVNMNTASVITLASEYTGDEVYRIKIR